MPLPTQIFMATFEVDFLSTIQPKRQVFDSCFLPALGLQDQCWNMSSIFTNFKKTIFEINTLPLFDRLRRLRLRHSQPVSPFRTYQTRRLRSAGAGSGHPGSFFDDVRNFNFRRQSLSVRCCGNRLGGHRIYIRPVYYFYFPKERFSSKRYQFADVFIAPYFFRVCRYRGGASVSPAVFSWKYRSEYGRNRPCQNG